MRHWDAFFLWGEGLEPSTDAFKEVELVAYILQRRIPFEAVVAGNGFIRWWIVG
jgi:hypothetical protein